MCFSATADLAVGAALLPVAVATLREVRHWREVPFALLPLIFAVHQFVEAALWLPRSYLAPEIVDLAIRVYLFIAFPLLPALVPIAILLLEPRGARLRVAPFVAIGAVVSGYLAVVVLTRPVGTVAHAHALEYQTEVTHGYAWAVLYVLAVIGPALVSGYPSIVAFGAINLVGLIAVAALYLTAFASLWCVLAATVSMLCWLHMYRRRRLPDPHRLEGIAPRRSVPA